MKIALIGYGKEGKAAHKYFTRHAAKDGTADDLVIDVIESYDPQRTSQQDFSGYDLIFRSPSVPPRPEFSSMTRYFFAHCPAPIIGVTGTKGKGTTCSMITELLRAFGRQVYLLGNIGVPSLDYLDKIKKDDVVVYEMSSFQLWDLTQSPHIAVVLRIEPDHLNVHKDFADYVGAKSHIAKYQTPDDSIIYFKDNPDSIKIAELSPGHQIPYPIDPISPALVEVLDSLTVPGQHNRENAEAALLAVAAFLDTSLEELIQTKSAELSRGLANFHGLPHHIEHVRTLHGVEYYDDNFSTAAPALEVALRTFAGRPLYLIAGGQDKGIDYQPIQDLIFGTPGLEKAILIGEIAPKLAAGIAEDRYILADSLEDAVKQAQKLAESTPGASNVPQGSAEQKARFRQDQASQSTPVVLMSPGAASLDMFKDYYDRGQQFQEYVKDLT